jgi:26S proteasome regulatory subunit T3
MEVDTIAKPAKAAVQNDDDLYSKLKRAQRQVEMLDIQEEYIKDEMKNLKRELLRAQEEVKRIQVKFCYRVSAW